MTFVWGGSYWDGRSRAFLRGGLAVIVSSNLASVASEVWQDRAGVWSHPQAPTWLLSLGGSPLVWLLAALGVAGAVHFARQPGRWLSGAIALATMALLVEADGALNEGPKRHFFAPGLALLGWLAGLLFAKLLAKGQRQDGAWLEAHAEMGAVAALAGNYTDAGQSKLLHVGPGWANETTLRAVILTHHPLGDGSFAGTYAHWVAGSAATSQLLAVATLCIQVGACLMLLGPRLRLLAALGIIGFHSNVALLANIGYGPAREALLLFALPWPRLAARIAGRWPRFDALFATTAPAPPPPSSRSQLFRAALLFAALALVIVAIARALPISAYAALHHSYSGERAGPRPQP